MVHAPVLSTDLFATLAATRVSPHAPQQEPFNLFKFLVLKGEFQQVVDIYEAFYASESEPDQIVSGQASKKPSSRSREQDRLQEIRLKYSLLINSSLTAEDDYWIGFAQMGVKKSVEAVSFFERAFSNGYLPAANFLANFAQESGENGRASELLNRMKPFSKLRSWDRAIALREQGKLFEDAGQFRKAQGAYRASWSILNQLPDAQILLGFAGQLFAWTLELLGKNQEALEVVRTAKQHARAHRRVQLLYLQILAAAKTKQFDEAYLALEELEAFIPNDPYLQGLASNAAGEIARFRGHSVTAIGEFENTIVASSGAQTDLAFSANLFASHCSLALGSKEGALSYLEHAEEEFFFIAPFLTPGCSTRAQANLAFRRGTLDVALRNPTAVEHLENARQIFKGLGLPLGQCLALLHLAGWYELEGDRERALERLRQSQELRKQFQDIGSYEAELVLLPQLRPLLEELEAEVR